jgi:hypothetical protein
MGEGGRNELGQIFIELGKRQRRRVSSKDNSCGNRGMWSTSVTVQGRMRGWRALRGRGRLVKGLII